tara:strand:- start:133 stop:312 length:180 start_codon:yes stop_codon:yes gene_type:complete
MKLNNTADHSNPRMLGIKNVSFWKLSTSNIDRKNRMMKRNPINRDIGFVHAILYEMLFK